MLSVVTVCFNSEKTIKETIDSVLNQTDCNIEHIFIDGNSTDATVSIIKSYQNDYNSRGMRLIIVSEPDKGIYDAMNKGIRIASGSIVGILNSDDWYESDTSAIVQKNMYKNPDADILMGAIRIDNHGQKIIKRIRKSFWITSRNFNHPGMFVRKKCYEDLGNYDLTKFYADFNWYLHALQCEKKVIFTDAILANFRIGGVSSQKSFRTALQRIQDRYQVYRDNQYSRLYLVECIFQELAKYCLICR